MNTPQKIEGYSGKVIGTANCLREAFNTTLLGNNDEQLEHFPTVRKFAERLRDCKVDHELPNTGVQNFCKDTKTSSLSDYIWPNDPKKSNQKQNTAYLKLNKLPFGSLRKQINVNNLTVNLLRVVEEGKIRGHTIKHITLYLEENGENYPLLRVSSGPKDTEGNFQFYELDRTAIIKCPDHIPRSAFIDGHFIDQISATDNRKPTDPVGLRKSSDRVVKLIDEITDKINKQSFNSNEEFYELYTLQKYLLATAYQFESERGTQFNNIVFEQSMLAYAQAHLGVSNDITSNHWSRFEDGNYENPEYAVLFIENYENLYLNGSVADL